MFTSAGQIREESQRLPAKCVACYGSRPAARIFCTRCYKGWSRWYEDAFDMDSSADPDQLLVEYTNAMRAISSTAHVASPLIFNRCTCDRRAMPNDYLCWECRQSTA